MKTILYIGIMLLFFTSFISETREQEEWEVLREAAKEIGLFVYTLNRKNTGHYKDWAEKRLKQWSKEKKVSKKNVLLLHCKECENDSFFIMNMKTVSLQLRRTEGTTPMTLTAKEGSILENTIFREFESGRGGYNRPSVSTRLNVGKKESEKVIAFIKAFENYQNYLSK
jgi:ribosomal protein L44E